ncbi:MAG: exodeoxyribonuclease VII large subunit [Spirochaetota bacterium]
MAWQKKRLFAAPIRSRIRALADRRAHLEGRLKTSAFAEMQRKRAALESVYGRMYALSPAAVLARGYSITRRLPDGAVLTEAGAAEPGRDVEVLLSKGSIIARIQKVNKNGKKEL